MFQYISYELGREYTRLLLKCPNDSTNAKVCLSFYLFCFEKFFLAKYSKGVKVGSTPIWQTRGYISALEAIIFFGVNARERERFKIYGLLNTER